MRRIARLPLFIRCAGRSIWPALVFTLCACRATSQELPPSVAPATPQGENPRLLLAPEQAPGARTETDYSRQLYATLSDTLGERFTVVDYDAKHTLIRRALREHDVAAPDVTSPQSVEAVERVATAIGARYIFRYNLKIAPDMVTADIQFLKRSGQSDWVVGLGDTVQTQTMSGKRRLKTSDIVAVVVDGIAQRLAVPSHLTAKRNQASFQTAMDTAAKQDAAHKTKPDSKPDNKTKAEPVPPPTADAGGSKPQDAQTPPAPANGKATTPDSGTTKTPDKPTKAVSTPAKQPSNGPPSQQPAQHPQNPPPPVIPDPSPTLTNVAPPRPEATPDPAIEAARYRQTGDLANAIVCMRHAIDARPSDMTLRRDLVKDYQQKHMFDAAAAEAERALRIDPSDSHVLREYGDLLLAQGNAAGALKYYRLATEKDPQDVVAQIALGDALLASGQTADAIEIYRTASQKDARSLLPHLRMARALAARASTDTAQYTASLQELNQARSLMTSGDNDTYRQDYSELMRLMDGRLRSLSEEAVTMNQAQLAGRLTLADARRGAEQLALRIQAASDFLDNVTPAAGLDRVHLQYQQAAALTLQATQLFRDYLEHSDTLKKDQWDAARLTATRTLNAAARGLAAAQAPQNTTQ
jgi:tetratricopeptide (TPR) repeat protein